ncbi:hypothetical protein FcAc13_05235 [Frischella sp. Ac13]|uniref:Uncharacterized protein n=1 Tax=Frischella japonica TaxID=2741544 RepID=A0ABR7QXC5_9GAMM|nr:hypothetical protein [Frischella japonica]MBC9130711.1 hypothetical protein [Frischella japonica]
MRIEWCIVILLALYGFIMFLLYFMIPTANKKIIPFTKKLLKELLHSMLNGLNSPHKRIGFVFLIIGIVIFLVSVININWSASKVIHDSIFSFGSRYYFNFGVFLGFYISILGLFMSFFYDFTIKKIIKWIFKVRNNY